MTAGGLLFTLRARGVILVAAGERLRYRPAALVSDEERAGLARHRGEVLRLLRVDDAVRLAAEVLGAEVTFRVPRGLRCGLCGGSAWRPRAGYPADVACLACSAEEAQPPLCLRRPVGDSERGDAA